MASIRFNNIYLGKSVSISSNDEKIFTKHTIKDYYNGEKTFEEAEEKQERIIIDDMLKSINLDLIIGADLSNQIAITSKTMANYNIPFLGIYNACASYPEGIIIASKLLDSKIKNIGVIVSSHNKTAEKSYRYPIEYGSLRKKCETYTLTSSVISQITKSKTNIKIESCTIGKVVDYNFVDVKNIGAVMAPSAASTLITHLKDLKRDISYYDLVITGDLGKIGSKLFKEILLENDITLQNYIDAGSMIITDENLSLMGGSGPVCLPLFLTEKIIKQNKYKHILIIGTGSLHNVSIVNSKRSVPSISHIVSLEVLN